MNINFNQKIFNKLFKVFYKTKDGDKRFTLCRGGAGSGKTYALIQFMLYITLVNKKERIVIIRKTSTSLDESLIPDFKEIIDEWGLSEYFEFNKQKKFFTCLLNGNVIKLMGLSDVESIKGLACTRLWIEECTELESEEAFSQLNLRLRGSKNMKMYLSFNPISKDNWVYKRFYEDYDRENCYYTLTTYKDNKFTLPEYAKQIEFLKNYDYNYYKIYALGAWGNLHSGGEAYKFKDSIINNTKYDPNLPIHISIDENVVPFISGIICQLSNENNKKVRVIKEYTLKDPENNIYDLCDHIKKDFKNHQSGLYIYGDSTSLKRDTKIKNGENFFSLICNLLREMNPTLRVPKSNPGVKSRIDWINQVMQLNRDGINILIDKECRKLIEDLQNVKETVNGDKFKQKVRDPKTKITYEKYGHLSDCFDYFLTQAFYSDYNKFKTGGKVNIQIPEGIYTNNYKY